MAYDDDDNGLSSLKNTIDSMFKRGNSDSAIKPTNVIYTRRKNNNNDSQNLDPFPTRPPAAAGNKPPEMPPMPPRVPKKKSKTSKYGADEVLAAPVVPSGPGGVRKVSKNVGGPAAPPRENESKSPIRKVPSSNSLFGTNLLAPIKNSLTRRKKKDRKEKGDSGSKLSKDKDNESVASVESSLPPNFRFSRLSNSSRSNLPPIRVSSRQELSYEDLEKSQAWKLSVHQNNGTITTRRQMGTVNTGTLREQTALENSSFLDMEENNPHETPATHHSEEQAPAATGGGRPGFGGFLKKVFRR